MKVFQRIFFQDVGTVDSIEKVKALLKQLNYAINIKHLCLESNNLLSYHNNTPIYASSVIVTKLHEFYFELLPYLPYSPIFSPQ